MLGRERLMHRAVAACWLENFDPLKQVHHINGNKTDNRTDNLECVTAKEHFGERHLDISSQIGKYARTEIARQKLREFRTGTIDSEETRNKKAAILAVVGPKTQCSFQGITYLSVAAGARAAGISPATFRLRCKSKNFPDYKLT